MKPNFCKEVCDNAFTLVEEMMYKMIYLGHRAEANKNKALKPFNLSITQYEILLILKVTSQEMTVKAIKMKMVGDSPNVSRSLKSLEDKKLINKTKARGDKRQVLISLSDKGYKLLLEIQNKTEDEMLGESISLEDIESLRHTLIKLGENHEKSNHSTSD